MPMASTADIRIIGETTLQQSLHGFIRAAGHTPIKPDPGLSQSCLSASADSAADQRIHLQGREHSRQSPMSISIRAHNLGLRHFSVHDVIHLKLLCMTKMLKHHSVFICDRKPHLYTSCKL